MTVAELRAALAGYPDDMPVAVRTRQAPGAEDGYCIGVDALSVRDIWHEDDSRGWDDPDAEGPQPVPTLIINIVGQESPRFSVGEEWPPS